jgi:hypothetical protein
MYRFIPALVATLVLLSPLPGSAASQTWSYAIVGDGGDWGANAQSVRDSIVRLKETELLMPGDNLYPAFGSYAKEWGPWISSGLKFKAVAIGNHHGGYEQEIAFFKMPGEFYSTPLAEGQIQLTVLNSDNRANAAKQAEFLEATLKSSQAPFHLVMYHHPSLTITSDHSWQERKAFQELIRPILFRYRSKLTAILNGHDHIASLHEFNDLPVIVSGAVQDTRSPEQLSNTQEGITVRSRWLFQESPHWARLRLSPENKGLIVDYIRADSDQVVCTLELQTGKAAKLGNNCR